MAVTLRDVAERAGVSIRTVSNVVNDFPAVSDSTRTKVQKSLDELGYRPNLAARQLRSGQTGMVGLLLPQLGEQYFAALAEAVSTAGSERNLTVAVEQTQGRRDAELAPRTNAHHLWDGTIVSALSLTEEDLQGWHGPLVVLGEHTMDFDLCWVGSDSTAAAREATEFLLSSGRRRVAVVGHQKRTHAKTGKLRTAGYRAAMRSAGVKPDPDWVVEVPAYDAANGFRSAERLLSATVRPDSILCFNDQLAFGVLRALHDHGVRVPDDIAVLGWDDVRQCEYSVPRLSSVSVSLRTVAESALDELRAQIQGHAPTRRHLVVPHQIVQRQST